MQDKPENKKPDNGDSPSSPNADLLRILANSLNSSLKYGAVDADTTTRKCSSCGAARPADTNLAICDFCGNSF